MNMLHTFGRLLIIRTILNVECPSFFAVFHIAEKIIMLSWIILWRSCTAIVCPNHLISEIISTKNFIHYQSNVMTLVII